MESIKDRQRRLMLEALDIVNGSRQAAYGPPERNFSRIAALWSAYLEIAFDAKQGRYITRDALTAVDVCHMLDLLKLARLVVTPDHQDSIRDRFGYQACYVGLVSNEWVDNEWVDWPADTEPPPAADMASQDLGPLPAGTHSPPERDWKIS